MGCWSSVNVDQDEQFLQCGQYPAHTVMLAGQSLHALINRQMTSLWATLLNDSKSYGSIDEHLSTLAWLQTACKCDDRGTSDAKKCQSNYEESSRWQVQLFATTSNKLMFFGHG